MDADMTWAGTRTWHGELASASLEGFRQLSNVDLHLDLDARIATRLA
jgi:hypothetical protein